MPVCHIILNLNTPGPPKSMLLLPETRPAGAGTSAWLQVVRWASP